jgi:3-oxoacyl-[acyl-carrier-protein] synthase III
MNGNKSIKIISSGIYLPKAVSSAEIEEKYGLEQGWCERYSGVSSRHHVTFESIGYMGARAIENALEKSKMQLQDIDLIISAGASYDYPLPNQASVIKSELKNGLDCEVGCIDIDTTCLSFVSAFDMASKILDGKQYKNIIVVSVESASKGLSSNRTETITLFGDGAAAFIFTYDDTASSFLIKSSLKTFAEGMSYTIIKGGGMLNHFRDNPYDEDLFAFEMNGIQLLKIAKKKMPDFISAFFSDLEIKFDDVNVIIPHQASKMGLALFKNMFELRPNQFKENLSNKGNCIAASIPILLHEIIEKNELERGDLCLLLGTSAGFSIGSLLFKF